MQIPAPTPQPPFRRFAAVGDAFSSSADGDLGAPWPEQAARAVARDGGELAVRNVAVSRAASIDVAILQLHRAVEFRPDLVSVICGADDVLLPAEPDVEVFAAVFEGIVDSLRRSLPHATIVTATYPRVVEPSIEVANGAIREIAARRGLICLEWAGHPHVDDPRSFARGRFGFSAEGHRRAAAAFAEVLRCAAAGGPAASR